MAVRTPHAGCHEPAWKDVRPSMQIFLLSSKRPLGVRRRMSGADIG
jgi:hypothetical protein